MRNSYRSDRAGDVLMALCPGWLWAWGSNSTTHGQPVENDLHVPLMFWGVAIRKGRHNVDASPTDLAPTLGALLGVRAGAGKAVCCTYSKVSCVRPARAPERPQQV